VVLCNIFGRYRRLLIRAERPFLSFLREPGAIDKDEFQVGRREPGEVQLSPENDGSVHIGVTSSLEKAHSARRGSDPMIFYGGCRRDIRDIEGIVRPAQD
jgi:hypothetical protein